MNIYKSESGFTLVELITALAIIGILSSIVATNVIGVLKKSRDGQRKADLRRIQSALELYRADQGQYPAMMPNCPATGNKISLKAPPSDCSSTKTYMENVPLDPSTDLSYTYTPTLVGSDYLRYSLVACLENFNDPQKDDTSNIEACGDSDETNKWSYTLQNP